MLTIRKTKVNPILVFLTYKVKIKLSFQTLMIKMNKLQRIWMITNNFGNKIIIILIMPNKYINKNSQQITNP